MQMAQDAPKLVPNLLIVSAEDMMHMRKVWEKSKNICYKKKTQYIICNFPTEIQFLQLYQPHMEYEKVLLCKATKHKPDISLSWDCYVGLLWARKQTTLTVIIFNR